MSRRVEEVIPPALDGERVDRVVALVGDLSRSVAATLIADGAVGLSGRVVTSGSTRVAGGDALVFSLPPPTDRRPVPDPSIQLVIRHEDDHVVVVDKPAGLVVHPGAGHEDGTLVNALVHWYPELVDVGEEHRPGIVHRLDRGTSGLLVVARTPVAYDALVRQMSAREATRVYTALVWGHPKTDEGVIDAPIGRSPRHPTRMAVTERGRPAITRYSVLERHAEPRATALLGCRLETGRTHQIRVHLRAIGHPVVGDRDYDGGRPGLDPGRQFLHAGELRFAHPVTAAGIAVTAPLPSDLEVCLARCR